ncbi:MAG: hypothetical protein ABS81_00920 [Pseudonocardia sp. SCN 72-86]|nr:MAG: hypothetical protein ABS81_00920 [Pseudonocardia sp. SCN 72-86]
MLVLAIALCYACLAMSFDVVFGYAGLLSFGHVLYFAVGVYGTQLLMARGFAYPVAAVCVILLCTVGSAGVGAITLRTHGIAFAMVTLAFAEAFYIFVVSDPFGITGKTEGLPLTTTSVPDVFVGVRNTANLYYLALALAAVVFVLCWMVVRSHLGRAWVAARGNERRYEALGMPAFRPKLLALVTGGGVAGATGAVYLLMARNASPSVADPIFALEIIVMLVLGGVGRVWGAAIGGFVYALLTLRLPALGQSGALDVLPAWMSSVLSEPQFVIGVVFVLFVIFVPGGLSTIVLAIGRRWSVLASPRSSRS